MAGNKWEEGEPTFYNISRRKRLTQVAVTVFYLLFSAGVVFGFAALKPLLINEGVYRQFCTSDEVNRGVPICYMQEIRLNLLFTAAAVASNVSALPIGAILDAYGPRLTGIVGCTVLAVGSVVFAFGGAAWPVDGYLCGYLLLAIGGPFVYISSFHLSNTFPKRSGLILAAITGAFDCSSALFLLFRLLHGRFNGHLSTRALFLFYLIVPASMLGFQILLLPEKSYRTVRELLQHVQDTRAGDEEHEDDSLLPRRRMTLSKIHQLLQAENDDVEEARQNAGAYDDSCLLHEPNRQQQQTWGVMHMSSALQQIRSPWFILMTVFAVLQMLRINYFISTIDLQYEYLLPSRRLATQLTHVFDILLPLSGIIATPFVGTFLDHARMQSILSATALSATVIGILGVIPNRIVIAYIHIGLFTLFRPFFYTVISDYAAKVFGFQTFGKVFGLMVCLAGIGNFLQPPLDILTFKGFRGNPTPVNVILTTTAFVSGSVLVIFVFRKTRPQRQVHDSCGATITDADLRDNAYAEETDSLLPCDTDASGDMPYGVAR